MEMPLVERRADHVASIEALEVLIGAIVSGRISHQSKDGPNEPWHDETEYMLNHYRFTKQTYQKLIDGIDQRLV